MRSQDYLVFGLFFFYLFLVIVKVVLEHSLTTDGFSLAKTQAQIKDLTRENQLLKEQILTNRSYRILEAEALAQGYSRVTTKTYLVVR